jgi:hypothetical protein
VVPGSFTTGTNHFANAGHAEDSDVADAYEALTDQVASRLADLTPDDADPTDVARQIARVVDRPGDSARSGPHRAPATPGSLG